MKKRIEQIKAIKDDWMESYFYVPATEVQIEDFEEQMKITIPQSYKDFLLLSNGAKLFGGDCFLYGVGGGIEFKISDDFSEGKVPAELLIVGFYHSSHICYDSRYNSFIFYEYENLDEIESECLMFSDFDEVLDYMIDIATS